MSFSVDPTYLAVLSNDQSVDLYDMTYTKVIVSYNAPFRLDNRIYINDSVVWINALYELKGIVIERDQQITVEGYIKYCSRESGSMVIYKMQMEDGQKIFEKWVGQTTAWKLSQRPYVINRSLPFLVCKKDADSIAVLDNLSGKQLWQKSLSEPFHHFIEVTDQIVWLTSETGRILGMNVHTGEVQYNLFKPANYPTSWAARMEEPTFYLNSYTQLDTQQNKLFGLRGETYWEIDLNNPSESYTLYDLKEHFHAYQMEANAPFLPAFNNNRIFFGSIDRKGPTIGAFDRQQRKITWTSEVAKTDNYLPSVRQIAYMNKRLYALDGVGTLHIFEED